jgi:hypothetical protein
MRSINKIAPGLFIYESAERKIGTFNSLAFIIQRPEFESIRLNGNYLQTRRNGKSGLRTLRNGIILEDRFDTIFSAQTGFYALKWGDSVQIADNRGKWNLPPAKYQQIDLLNSGFALIRQNGKTGCWNPHDKKWILPPEDMQAEIAAGRDWVCLSRPGKGKILQEAAGTSLSNTEWDFLDLRDPVSHVRASKAGKIFLISSRNQTAAKGFEEIIPLGNRFFACREQGKMGLLFGDNKLVIPFQFESIRKLSTSAGWVFSGIKNGKEVLFNENGKALQQGEFDQILPATGKLFPARAEGRWGIARSDGSWLLENRFDSLQIIFRLADECRFPLAFFRKGKSVLINETGKEISEALPCQWLDAGEGKLFRKKDGQLQLFDSNGKQLGELSAADFKPFSEGNAAVKVQGSWGFINHSGRLVIPARFEELLPFANGLAYAREKGLWGVLRKNGSWLVKPSGIAVATDAAGKRKLVFP